MIRTAFKMQTPLEHAEEYKRRHDEIWPELVDALREAGPNSDTHNFDLTQSKTIPTANQFNPSSKPQALSAKNPAIHVTLQIRNQSTFIWS